MNQQKNGVKDTDGMTIVIPINLLNLTSLVVLFVLVVFGCYYIWKVLTRQKCGCKICKKEYLLAQKLDQGGFGEIYKVLKNDAFYILKKCKTEDITEADDILLEAKYLRDLDHKNIVKYIDDFIHVEFNKGNLEPSYFVIIIMEYCEGGDLKQHIDKLFYEEKSFPKKEVLDILIQLTEGLQYLHHKNIIHRDIKSQNIFFTKDEVLRIGDFGLAKKIKKFNRNSMMTKVGTDCYMAPELIRGEKYGKPADIWSVGGVIHEICTLNFMWMHDSPAGLSIITNRSFIEDFSNEIDNPEHSYFKNLIKCIFVVDANLRIKVETLLKKLKKERNLMKLNTVNSTAN